MVRNAIRHGTTIVLTMSENGNSPQIKQNNIYIVLVYRKKYIEDDVMKKDKEFNCHFQAFVTFSR